MQQEPMVQYSFFNDPSQMRKKKPRLTGLTMIMDKGLGPHAFDDLLRCSAGYIDFIKIGVGTSVLYTPDLLMTKVKMAEQHGITMYPGGTFLEVSLLQHLEEEYFSFLQQIGFSAIEISDGSMDMTSSLRKKLILKAKKMGLTVITEYGKKLNGPSLDLAHLKEVVELDWEWGASYTIVEGRESGKNVGIYNASGQIDESLVQQICQEVSCPERLIWETPETAQQVHLIKMLGRDVNLGNIAPHDIFSLEAIRRGLRSDTIMNTSPQPLIGGRN